jgi:hypothetical protein
VNQPKQLAFVALCIYAVVLAVSSASSGENAFVRQAASYTLSLIVCAWVLADAHGRSQRLWHDFDAMLFFAWPVLAPLYLFQTRGVRALIPILVFALILIVAYGGAFLLAQQLRQPLGYLCRCSRVTLRPISVFSAQRNSTGL